MWLAAFLIGFVFGVVVGVVFSRLAPKIEWGTPVARPSIGLYLLAAMEEMDERDGIESYTGQEFRYLYDQAHEFYGANAPKRQQRQRR